MKVYTLQIDKRSLGENVMKVYAAKGAALNHKARASSVSVSIWRALFETREYGVICGLGCLPGVTAKGNRPNHVQKDLPLQGNPEELIENKLAMSCLITADLCAAIVSHMHADPSESAELLRHRNVCIPKEERLNAQIATYKNSMPDIGGYMKRDIRFSAEIADG